MTDHGTTSVNLLHETNDRGNKDRTRKPSFFEAVEGKRKRSHKADDDDLYRNDASNDARQEEGIHLQLGIAVTGISASPNGSGWRERGAAFIHSKPVQIALMALLVLDVVLVIVELILQSRLQCHLHIEPSLCHGQNKNGSASEYSNDGIVSNSTGFYPPEGCGVFGATEIPHDIHHAEMIITWVSRAILMLFLFEIVSAMVCLGKHFFTALYMLDFVIVVLSLALSFVFDGSTSMQSETALIIFLRCWRFARVLHGVGVTVHNAKNTHEHSHSHSTDNAHHHGEDEASNNTAGAAELVEKAQKFVPLTTEALERKEKKELIAYCEELQAAMVARSQQ